MKIKLSQVLFFGILIQIIATQGILNFYFFNKIGHWEFKTLLHPISFLLIVFIFLIRNFNKIRLTPLDSLFFLYLLGTFLFIFVNVDSLFEGYVSFRDVYMLFILIFIYNQVSLTKKQWDIILKTL